MINPYEPPSQGSQAKTRGLFFLAVLLLVIAVLTPILGLAATVFSMMDSVDRLSQSESPSPDVVAGSISFSLVFTVIGLVIGIVVGICGVIVLGRARRGASSSQT